MFAVGNIALSDRASNGNGGQGERVAASGNGRLWSCSSPFNRFGGRLEGAGRTTQPLARRKLGFKPIDGGAGER